MFATLRRVRSSCAARFADQGRLKKASLSELRYDLGDVEVECRFILSGGKGPVSLRGGKLIK